MKRSSCLPLFLLMLAFASDSVQAAIAERLTVQDLVARSDAIVVGRCTGLESTWIERNLVTRATVTLDRVLKGRSRPALTVLLPGGVDTTGPLPIAMDFYGAPSLALDEEVLLFLAGVPEQPGSFTILGFSQGKFSLVTEGERTFALRDIRNLALKSGDGVQRGSLTRRPLAAFEREIRNLIGPGATPEPINPPAQPPTHQR